MKYFLLLIFMMAFNQQTTYERTHFFPKTEVKVNTLPARGNVWVFILAGQSNMAGRGFVEPEDTVANERVLTINRTGEIILAKEPLHFYEPTMAGLDCGLTFGKELVKQLSDSISVLILPTAVGGSSISKWLGDSMFRNVQLLTNFSEKVELGKRYGNLKGVLWHQGESDSKGENIAKYGDRLEQLFAKFREIAGDENLPIEIGELGAYSNNAGNWLKINAQINKYAATDKNTGVVKTSDLKDRGDKLHFNSEGQRTLGRRFAKEFIEIYSEFEQK